MGAPAADAPRLVNSGSGCPALADHGTSDAQREIKRRIWVEDEMGAALARYIEVQGNARALAVDREQPFSVSPLSTVQGMGAGLPAGRLAVSWVSAISPTPLGGLVRPARALPRSGRPKAAEMPR
jgi:hypothetical protein